mmetsp:Transcript_2989/g.14104  ORF Transcript_2989/g.14104 Transcript_2989/m.14104 type:complete len:132 (-) Transcript_2989:3151-3546(-)
MAFVVSGFAGEPVRTRASRRTQGVTMVAAESSLKTDESARIMKEAQDLMPGGVNSPVRAFKSVGGGPVVFDRVKGSKAYDVDGNEYVDYIGSWGMYGYHQCIKWAVGQQHATYLHVGHGMSSIPVAYDHAW